MSAGTLAVLTFFGLISLLGGLFKYQEYLESQPLVSSAEEPIKPKNYILRRVSRNVPQAAERINFEDLEGVFKEIIEFLRTDGNPGVMPSGGVSWIAFFFCFFLLSPILIPLIFSPLILLLVTIPAIYNQSNPATE